MRQVLYSHTLDGTVFSLYRNDEGRASLWMYPEGAVVDWDKPCDDDPIVHLKLVGDRAPWAFSQGRTMRGAESTKLLTYVSHSAARERDGELLTVELSDGRAHTVLYRMFFPDGYGAAEVWTEFRNDGGTACALEMLTSFSFGGLTPFEAGISPENLYLHRFRSCWSKEGLHERVPLELLQLEPSASNASANSVRFGSIGSYPVREFFPVCAVEDQRYGCFWAAQLLHPCSWQLEAYRKDEALCVSGGIADREFGHWVKHVAPGGSFTTPKAWLTACSGDIDAVMARLTDMQARGIADIPHERDLPVIYNEWCTTWGRPTLRSVRAEVEKLKGRGIGTFVIDSGWYDGDVGDWDQNLNMYPSGMREVTDVIRSGGMQPGVWFEMENCTERSRLFAEHPDWCLTRDGLPLRSSARCYLDMRKPEVREHLRHKVIGFLRDNRFAYVKVDYNDNIGIGCDGAESLGEGLRQNMMASQDFFREMRETLPELMIEICASGGHRLEPSMLALGSMASGSDAHELPETPLVAAESQRLVQPRLSQVWVTLRGNFSEARTVFALASGFLGRFCLSGDVLTLSDRQNELLDQAIGLYHQISSIIKAGRTHIDNHRGLSWREPAGHQIVRRASMDGNELLVVAHTFANFGGGPVRVQLESGWEIKGSLCGSHAEIARSGDGVEISGMQEFDGAVVWLERG